MLFWFKKELANNINNTIVFARIHLAFITFNARHLSK